VYSIAERIEDRGDFLIDIRSVPPDVGHGQRNELSERPLAVNADAQRVRAKMPSACKAIAAASADHVSFAADDIARIKIADIRPDLDDLTNKFVADRHRDRNGFLRPLVPLVDVNVGAADAGIAHAYQHIVDADSRLGNIFEPQTRLCLSLNQCFHSLLLPSLMTGFRTRHKTAMPHPIQATLFFRAANPEAAHC
jgi:hypothetical protein